MDNKFKDFLKTSGNNLHIETANLLEDLGWEVDISSYYHDDTTDKPREIDIVAKKVIEIFEPVIGKISFNVFLFIECKYFKKDIAFRMYNNDENEAIDSVVLQYMDFGSEHDRRMLLKKEHHYNHVPFVAKLYDSQEDKQVFNAITGTVKSLSFFKDRTGKTGIYYPVVVFSGIDGVYPIEGNDLSKLDEVKKTGHLLFSINYSYRKTEDRQLETQRFYIDFVSKSNLKNFINEIENKEISNFKNLANFHLITQNRETR